MCCFRVHSEIVAEPGFEPKYFVDNLCSLNLVSFLRDFLWQLEVLDNDTMLPITKEKCCMGLSSKKNIRLYFYLFIYCILGFGVYVQNMQDSCIGTHMAVCFAAFLPFTHIWHFSSGYPSQLPPPLSLPYSPQQTLVCSAPLLMSMCSHFSTLAYE